MDDQELDTLLTELEHRGGPASVLRPVARIGRAVVENSERLDKMEARLAERG